MTHFVHHAVLALTNFVYDPVVPKLILFLRYHNKLKMDALKSKPSLSDQLKSKHSLEKEQVRQVDEVEQYLTKNKIDALFNEMLTGLVMRRPDDIRSDLLATLRKLKKGRDAFRRRILK